MRYINELKNIYNDAEIIKDRIARSSIANQSDYTLLEEYETKKKTLVDYIIRIKDDYLEIDIAFEKEMKTYRDKMTRGCQLCGCLKV